MNKTILFIFIVFNYLTVFSQSKKEINIRIKDSLSFKKMDPLTPAKAAFYSAVLPGLGQAYNKKYWKIPLVYGAIGTSLYFFTDSRTKYKSYRNAYKRRLEGYTDDQYPNLDNNRLITAQRFYQRNKDFSALFMVAFYVLNIIDANIDASLMQFNINDDLSLKPNIERNNLTAKANLGLTLHYNF